MHALGRLRRGLPLEGMAQVAGASEEGQDGSPAAQTRYIQTSADSVRADEEALASDGDGVGAIDIGTRHALATRSINAVPACAMVSMYSAWAPR